jgi:hypothetical protein
MAVAPLLHEMPEQAIREGSAIRLALQGGLHACFACWWRI